MKIEEFEQALGDFGQNRSSLDDVLLAAGGRLVDEIKQRAPVSTGSTGGALKNSIRAIVQDNTLTIGMLVYGMFQNYGVNGRDQSIADIVQAGVLPRPSNGDTYRFGVREKGLKPKTFFNVDSMADILAEAVAENIINNV